MGEWAHGLLGCCDDIGTCKLSFVNVFKFHQLHFVAPINFKAFKLIKMMKFYQVFVMIHDSMN